MLLWASQEAGGISPQLWWLCWWEPLEAPQPYPLITSHVCAPSGEAEHLWSGLWDLQGPFGTLSWGFQQNWEAQWTIVDAWMSIKTAQRSIMAAIIFASTSTANIFCYFLPQFLSFVTSGLLGFPLKLKALLSCSFVTLQPNVPLGGRNVLFHWNNWMLTNEINLFWMIISALWK